MEIVERSEKRKGINLGCLRKKGKITKEAPG